MLPRDDTTALRRSRPPVLLAGSVSLFVLALGLYLVLPLGEEAANLAFNAFGVAGILLGAVGVAHHRPASRAPWVLVLSGYAACVAGDVLWTVEQQWLPGVHPAPSDAVYLFSYVLIGAGALAFVRGRDARRDLDALLDASVVTAGAAVVLAVFVIAPIAADSSMSPTAKIVASAYPLGDLFLLGVLARTVAARGARTASFRLLTASLTMTLVADTAWNLDFLSSDGVASRWVTALWLLGYVLVGAAAAVPSMRDLVVPEPPQAIATASRRRLTALGGGLMLPGVALLLDGADGDDVRWRIIGTGSLVLSALVLVRMTGLLGKVQVQARRLTELAGSDSLTGAPNRRSWDDELARAGLAGLERRTTLSVAILDLDHFKAFNDRHGHQAGDRLLQSAVAAWSRALPPGAMLARYGGEEFALLLPETAPDQALEVVLGLREVTPDGRTFSAGIAPCTPGTDPADAVAAADEALYAAKRAGRNRVVVHGIDLDAGAATLPRLTMVTQPIVDTRTFGVAGHEALARFDGDVPGGVQEVFRRAHLDGRGDLLELAAVRAAMDLPGRTPGHELFVNVTAPALVSPRFLAGLPDDLAGVVIELGEDPEHVAPEDVATALDALRARGARVALDDVGAGAQEFARLAVLRPDVIKVDRSLVNGCSRDEGRTAVLAGLVTFAGHLGLSVCAEGVEDLADLDHLVSLGVSHVQGYLLAKPAPGWQQEVPGVRPAARVATAG
jgi:diguanylate cyclase (GGDEF)-like protein